MNKNIVITFLLGLFFLAPLSAKPIDAAGLALSRCAACHGQNGISVAPNFPNLAGQHSMYLETQMIKYKTGVRKDPVMSNQVMSLTKEEIKALADYYSQLK